MTVGRFVTAAVAAAEVGVSVRTIRRWMANGQLTATGGKRDRLVDLDAVRYLAAANGHADTDRQPLHGHTDRKRTVTEAMAVLSVVEDRNGHDRDMVAALWERNDRLYRENLELAGRLGFYQARIQELERRILELEAPKEAPVKMANHPTHIENEANSGSQKASPRPWWRFWR